ncbi:acetyl/propionyl/methylcrotonyl-CoA carboxylase subunit alpha [Propioniferax innocua]|uniref:biotin carboxylase n=1 Tax=Propioniferax innocua TaxID=1753 RepID=A0A542ZSH5_9ACTN|nr:biotin carboxylase N-terminal domain-containing protein [Propioniferax innocua]TQL63305.1 acetyl-CoA/propionyl-CoA carboxylase biotin carboxyl carrier protein [Propioniferax innocua]
MSSHFDTVLIANRGEIAVRVIRTLQELGIRAVAVYSDADRDALHVHLADAAVYIGPTRASESYLNIDRVIDAAKRSGAQAIHPGYGFLSENAKFARACEEAGVEFIGPPASAIETMGDKITAKAAVSSNDVPTVPGVSRPGLTDEELIEAAGEVGYPVLIKPSAGGGGKGMRRVEKPEDMQAALTSARRESSNAFGDDTLFLERFVDTPRHIEVQVLADKHGNVVHLGERECSLQRRHQKVIEEAPSPLLDEQTRARIGEAACNAARAVDYVGAGTVEFIVSAHRPDEFFFMEMNTRLQVEHPVTEEVTGEDLVAHQVAIAAGEPLAIQQESVTLTGHSIEARVYAEDPSNGFLPTGGTVLDFRSDADRCDTGVIAGSYVSSDYDPMLAKVIVHAPTRGQALDALDDALAGTVVGGLQTNIDFCRFLINQPLVRAGDLDTGLLDRVAGEYVSPRPPFPALVAGAIEAIEARLPEGASVLTAPGEGPSHEPWRNDGWRLGQQRTGMWARFLLGEKPVCVGLDPRPGGFDVRISDEPYDLGVEPRRVRIENDIIQVQVDLLDEVDRSTWAAEVAGGTVWVTGTEGTVGGFALPILPLYDKRLHADELVAEISSPMPGSVIAVHVADGDHVDSGAPVITVEAMKMEHTLTAPSAGVVTLSAKAGEQVGADQVLASVDATDEAS